MPTSLLHTYSFWIPCVQWDLMKCSQEWKHRLVLSSSLHQVLQSIIISEVHNTDLFCWIALATGIAKIEADFKWKGSGDEKKLGWCSSFDLGFQTCLQQRIWWCWSREKQQQIESYHSSLNNTTLASMKYGYIWIKRQKQRGQRKLLMLLSIEYS